MTGKASTKTLPVSIKLLTKKQLMQRRDRIIRLEKLLRAFRDSALGPRPAVDWDAPPEQQAKQFAVIKVWDTKARKLTPLLSFLYEQRQTLYEATND